MSVLFSQTMRAIRADNPKYLIAGKVLILLVIFVWGYWFFFSSLLLFESSDRCRLEQFPPPHPLTTQSAGKVANQYMALGQAVQKDEVLLVLDGEELRLEQSSVQAEWRMLERQLAALEDQIRAQKEAVGLIRKEADQARTENEARLREAESRSEQAARESARNEDLFRRGILPEAEAQRTSAELNQSRARSEVQRASLARQGTSIGQEAALARAELAELEREREVQLARSEWLRNQNALYTHRLRHLEIRAPVSGTLADVGTYPSGSFVSQGETLGTILPTGDLIAVAWFEPRQSLARIFPGQRARIKLDGFPWTQFGYLPATVRRTGRETRDGRVRIEIQLEPPSEYRVPLQHGLPGTVEVEIERISPAALLWRMLGRMGKSNEDVRAEGT
ncbi:HlyD family efflux transporter periplasmic adaptor subunit [Sulfidibacter corallicola]|uniref:HlyD family efflux transporter periplasmic adaptor subunit n=1 Tax=Sulfidibacter corallicola TaxID=2818388 RepID=A0A8A4TFQ4_SULCO|nr:HlyD family efflux transporter periplasmic adaptor subunit [Sulfidibacter corallicola]QTD48034.1 HlyD family efflux transporter periplasmic adaptor subunit [Sulfidibacter corallicola]